MSDLAGTIAELVGFANDFTKSENLQTQVTLNAWTGSDVKTKPTYSSTVYDAVVTMRQRVTRDVNKTIIEQVATVQFVQPIPANGATGRKEPIDLRDTITLPSGWIGKVLSVSGVVDGNTKAPYCPTVELGP